jgi:hypothetical protein
MEGPKFGSELELLLKVRIRTLGLCANFGYDGLLPKKIRIRTFALRCTSKIPILEVLQKVRIRTLSTRWQERI